MDQELLLFATQNLNLAAALLSIGFDILGTDPDNPSKITFFFKKTPSLEQNVKNYWANIPFPILDFVKSRDEILTRINEDEGFEKYNKN